jgi:SEC-C motif
VSQVGRNDPCPCGSGLKFKKCCLNKVGTAVKSYSSAERESALSRLMRFSEREEFKEAHKMALQLFWSDWLLQRRDEDVERVMDSEQVNLAYSSWFAYDFDLGEGLTLFDVFLEREAKRLGTGERNFLEGMRGSHLRLYEILEVKPELGFELRDLWDDRRLYVRERAATRQLVAWDLIVGRIGPSGDGEIVFETLPYVFPAAAKDDLMKGLRKAHRVFTEEFGNNGIAEFFKRMAPVFHKLWLEQVALPPRPKIITGDGEPFIFAKVIFDLLDRDAAIRSLAHRDDIVDHGDGSYGWLEPAGNFQRSAGAIVIEEQRVIFETTSQKRAEKGRDELPSLLGGAVRFKAISYEDVGQALKRAPQTPKNKQADIPIEEQRRVLGEYYEQHYRKWLDEPVPALGNRTPRHAAKLKTVRPKLIALLKDFESRAERQRRAGKPAYDFSWMWVELGLNRE